jgi:arsenical pump membrane protein
MLILAKDNFLLLSAWPQFGGVSRDDAGARPTRRSAPDRGEGMTVRIPAVRCAVQGEAHVSGAQDGDNSGMHSSAVAEVVSAAALVAVLAWAVRRPRGWPEAVAAVPAAVLVAGIGAVSVSAAAAEARRLAPVVGFLGCVLVLAKLCDDEGLFRYLGAWLGGGRACASPVRLLGRVFAVAAATTAVLSLDATVVLLTPVVLIASGRLRVPARPHAYACGHLANSASLLLPVSNLTNLLAFAVSGLSFGRFAALMALPWLAAIAVEYVVIRRFFAADLAAPRAAAASSGAASSAAASAGAAPGARAAGSGQDGGGQGEAAPVLDDHGGDRGEPGAAREPDAAPAPVFSLVVVAATLGGFVLASAAGANPAWAALGGALLLAVRALARGTTSVPAIARSADVPFLLFVIALGIVVVAVVDNGLGAALRPAVPSGTSLPALLAIAALAAVLAAVVNNLPAVLVLIPLAAPGGAGAVLAVLIGVNIGPNLSYTGSLATLLWRRVLRASGADVSLGEFTAVGAAAVVPALAASVLCLWLALRW